VDRTATAAHRSVIPWQILLVRADGSAQRKA